MAHTFGAELRRLRKERSLTQDRLAEKCELSVDAIRRLERGAFSPTLNTMKKVASGLEVNLASIFQGMEAEVSSRTAPSLQEFIELNREAIMRNWEARMRDMMVPAAMPSLELRDSLGVFLKETAEALRGSRGEPDAQAPARTAIASEHSWQRLRGGFDIGSVVREFSVLREVVLDMASEADVVVTEAEQMLFQKCISTATANAVSEFSRQRDEILEKQAAQHFALIAHELRTPMATARTSLAMLRRKALVQPDGLSHVERIEWGLLKLGELIDDTLTTLRSRSGLNGLKPNLKVLALTDLLTEAEIETAAEAADRRLRVVVEAREGLLLDADRRLLRSAVTNLLRNALQFTPEGGEIILRGRPAENRVLIEVEDGCGGLTREVQERLLTPLVTPGGDNGGVGLGLAIAKMAVEAHAGTLRVTNLPARGCVFTLDLPARGP